ncbi:MAG: 2-oxoglutarate dehydrogenase complex dihydrolipoyllysine-residue succinyltransferase [Gammaproteobacteria bacterium]
MASDIKAPQFPESVAEGTVATWHKQPGDAVSRDELLVDIETDKVVLEVVAPSNGTLQSILKAEGETVESLEVLATFEEGAVAKSVAAQGQGAVGDSVAVAGHDAVMSAGAVAGPAVRKLLKENNLTIDQIPSSGKDGRVTKDDVVRYLSGGERKDGASRPDLKVVPEFELADALTQNVGAREERRVPMTRLRARVAERLMQAKNQTAMLTTFNEVNMAPLMATRKQYKDRFLDRHGVKLGFMSFFVRAGVEALKRFPAVNASIDDSDIVYHGFYDVGVAVSTDRGLVVPILRDADMKSFAEIEQKIVDYGKKARDGKLAIEDMTGGTFTISNGGVFGSLLSTPILNPPQTAILGMHSIQERPVAENGQVVIRPMMYLAMSYDHRLIDGKEAVQFLVTIKEFIEDPTRLLLDL